MILKSRYEVITASSGPEGLALVRQTPPDLVFLDIKMPGMSGIEVLKAIKQCDTHIEVVMMTAYASLETAREAVAYSASDYLIKPFTKADVDKAVGKALARRNEHTGSHHEIRAFLEQMRTLAGAATHGAPGQDLLQHAAAILEQSKQALHAAAALMHVQDTVRHTLTCQVTLGIPPHLQNTFDSPAWQALLTQTLVQRQPLRLPGTAATGERTEWGQMLSPLGWEAGTLFPVLAADEVLGVLVFLYHDPHEVRADWHTLGQAFADLVALAMQAHRRYCASQREVSQQAQRVAQLSILREMTRVIIDSLELHDMLLAMGEQLQAGLGYTGVSVWLHGQEAAGLQQVYSRGVQSSWQPQAAGQEVPTMLQVERGPNTHVIRAPIVLEGSTIGAVELVRDQQYGAVTEFESELIRMVLDYLGMAVKNSQLRAQLLQSEKLRALGEMAAGVAHNFKNILTTILGHTQLLLEDLEGEATVHDSLYTIEKAALDAVQVVQRIQTFVKSRAAAACQRTDLPLLLKEVLDATRPVWKEQVERQGRHIAVAFDPEPVPPVPCRAAELREVVTNLILNAIDAMPTGGRLAIRTYQCGRRACIAVADTGTGMTEEVRRRIFNPFFTTKTDKGTGLGLSVSHALIKGHGGEIEVQSTPGQGTTFVVKLPLEAAAAVPEED
jgi:signal transduction histidine kinase/DNA-binding response OmpR family regulator